MEYSLSTNTLPLFGFIQIGNGRVFVLSEYSKKYFYNVKDMETYFIHDEQKRLEYLAKYQENKREHYERKHKRDQEIWNEHNLTTLDEILDKLNK